MKARLFALVFALSLATIDAGAQGTAFTYQGRLSDNGGPANGDYGMVFYFVLHLADMLALDALDSRGHEFRNHALGRLECHASGGSIEELDRAES